MKNKVRDLRKEQNMTQNDLAEAVKVTRQTISSIETGTHDPSVWLAFRIANNFNRNIESVFIFQEFEFPGRGWKEIGQ